VLLITAIITLNETSSINRITLFNNSVVIDYMASLMKIITLIGAFLVLVISSSYLKTFNIFKIEYPILILSSVLGMMVMISSNDLMVFYMGLELQSLALYVLATFNRDQLKSSEAGLKYFVLSALSSGLLLYGCSLIYGFSGSTNFDIISNELNSKNYVLTFGIVFILVGLAFKISAVPFHMWAPDVYEGSPTSVTLFFTMVPKIAALTVFIRFLYVPFLNLIDQWQMIIIFLSIASMLFGAVAAIGQTNIKRLIAYSSIGHIGYTLAGLASGSNEGIQSSIVYITIYVIMNLAFFSCLLMLKRNDQYYENIDDLSGLSKNHPLLSLSMLVILFSLAGIPPLAGFFAKFYIFTAVIEQSMYFLAIVGLLSTVIAAFYYLRIIKIIYFDKEKEKYDSDHSLWLKFSLTFSTILILLYFIFPSQLIEVVSRINII
jgi:NADH-quinone oxidoreductase subunit N